MFLGKERQNRCKKKCNEYADGESCSHRIDANCRTNGYRASVSLRLEAAALRAALRRTGHRRSSVLRTSERGYSLIDRSRSALAITETELKLIAAPAIIGLRRMPNSG